MTPPSSSPGTGDPAPTLWRLARTPQIMRASLRVALVVGSVLTAINQGTELLQGAPPDGWRMMLTYLVPYFVATYGAATTQIRLHRAAAPITPVTAAAPASPGIDGGRSARSIACIHHVNVLVHNLPAAMRYYERRLGIVEMIREALPARGVDTARFRVGDSWVVLVSPTDAASLPGRHLAKHGEGLFLISFGVDDLAAALDAWRRDASEPGSPMLRNGLAGWQICDLPDAPGAPSVTQLCKL